LNVFDTHCQNFEDKTDLSIDRARAHGTARKNSRKRAREQERTKAGERASEQKIEKE